MCLKQYIVGRVLYLHNTKGGDQTKNTQQQLCTVVVYSCKVYITGNYSGRHNWITQSDGL